MLWRRRSSVCASFVTGSSFSSPPVTGTGGSSFNTFSLPISPYVFKRFTVCYTFNDGVL